MVFNFKLGFHYCLLRGYKLFEHVSTYLLSVSWIKLLKLKDVHNTELDDIKVETTADAGRAVETLDKALEEVSTAQAKLGANQTRLTHNIDNLSKGSMLTEQSVGRIMDADFAAQTAE